MMSNLSRFEMKQGELLKDGEFRAVAVPAKGGDGNADGFMLYAFATNQERMRVAIASVFTTQIPARYKRTGKQVEMLDAGLQVDFPLPL
jgi:hypothetical protein